MNYPGRTVEGGYVFKRDDSPPPLKSTSTTPGFIIAAVIVGIIAVIVAIVGFILIRRHYRRVAEDRVGFDLLVETKANRHSMLQTGVSIHYPIVPAPPVPLLAPAPTFRSFSKKRGPPRPRHGPGSDYGHSRSNTNTSLSSYGSAESTPTQTMSQVDTRSLTIITRDLQELQTGQKPQDGAVGNYDQGRVRLGPRGQPTYRQSTIDEAFSPINQLASSSLPYGSANKRASPATQRAPGNIYDDVISRRTRPSTKQPPEPNPPPNPDDAAEGQDGSVRRGRSRKRRSSISRPRPAALAESEDAVPRGLPPVSRRGGAARPAGASPPRDPSRPIAVFSPATAVENKRFSFKPKPSRTSTLVPPEFKLVVDDTSANEGKEGSSKSTNQT